MIRFFTVVLFLSCFLEGKTFATEKSDGQFLGTVFREYNHDEYCPEHFISRDVQISPELLSRIPAAEGRCYHIECSKCHKTWVEEVWQSDEDGKVLSSSFEWFCECKDALRQQALQEKGKLQRSRYDDFMKMRSWSRCEEDSIYYGYFDSKYKKYFPFFLSYLEYLGLNPSCVCFWPEKSVEARFINELACTHFFDLFQNTRLRELCDNKEMQEKFGLDSDECLTAYGLALQCTTHAFFYSDYRLICKDLLFFTYRYYSGNDLIEIQEKIDAFLDALDEWFTELYQKCHRRHFSDKVFAEIKILQAEGDATEDIGLDLDDSAFSTQSKSYDKSYDLAKKFYAESVKLAKKPQHSSVLQKSVRKKGGKENYDVWATRGEWFCSMMLYKDAIEAFTHALQINPKKEEAFLGRAFAYFELGQLENAIADYKKAQELLVVPPYSINKGFFIEGNELVFTKGLIAGIFVGGAETVKGFVPGLLSSFTGLGRGLWAFVLSPQEVSSSFVTNICLTVEYVKQLPQHRRYEFFAPEFCELVRCWEKLEDYDKGYKTGYLIGKYGLNIFAFRGSSTGIRCPRIVKKYKQLQRTDTLLTLEQCANSSTKKAVIVAKTTEHAVARAAVINASKGKIFVRNINTQHHILLDGHCWKKLVIIGTKEEENINRVISLLEEHDILNLANLKKTKLLPTSEKLILTEYEVTIECERVRAKFVTNTETGERFLNDAWVITKEP